jgi:hypothetical protein
MAGAGLFGASMGLMAPVAILIMHWIFGAVLGWVYGALLPTEQADASFAGRATGNAKRID